MHLLDKYAEFGAAQFEIPQMLEVPPINRSTATSMEIASALRRRGRDCGQAVAESASELLRDLITAAGKERHECLEPESTEQPRTTAQQLGSLIKSARDIMRKDKGLNGDIDRLPMLTWIMFLKFLDDMEQHREEKAKLAGKRYRPAIEPPYRWRDWAADDDGITGPELIAFVNQEECTRPDGTRGPGLFAYLRGLQVQTATAPPAQRHRAPCSRTSATAC